MFGYIRRYVKYKRSAHFWDWVRKNYSDDELKRLTEEATDCCLLNSFGSLILFQGRTNASSFKEFIHDLYECFGDDLLSACLGAGGFDPEHDLTGMACLAKLDRQAQVHNKSTLEEFLVRNALKHAAKEILKERVQRK